LRVRGATTTQILRLAGIEAVVVGVGGMVLGLALAAGAAWWIAPDISLLDQRTAGGAIAPLLAGGLPAVVAGVFSAWRHARHTPITAARVLVGRVSQPLWQRLYLDVIVLGGAMLLFWRTASTGYQIVLAPEGVPQTAVAYESFLAPLGIWVGAALLLL